MEPKGGRAADEQQPGKRSEYGEGELVARLVPTSNPLLAQLTAASHRRPVIAVGELGRIGNNLNQLTRVANATGRIDLSRRLDFALHDLSDAIRRLA